MTTQAISVPRPEAGSGDGPRGGGFGSLLRAEWIKFRSVRGWVIGMILAALLTIFLGVFAAANANIGCQINGGPPKSGKACLPYIPHGPGGEVVTDSFSFARQPLTGNGTITARVTSLTGEHANLSARARRRSAAALVPGLAAWAKAGIIIKQSTHQGSAYAAMMVTGSHGVRMQYNFTGDTAGMPGAVSAAHPRWLRLTRSGDTITGYDSADGTHWTQVGTVQLAGLPSTVQVGMFATSPGYTVTQNSFGGASNNGGPAQATGVFDHVSLAGGAPGGTWTGTAIGGGGPAGAGPGPGGGGSAPFTRNGGRYTLTGSGDIAPVTPGPDGPLPTVTIGQSLAGAFLGLIAIVVVAAMFFSTEYRRGLIRTTLAATPRRGAVLAAKAVVIGAVAFVTGLVAAVVSIGVGVPKEENSGPGTADRARADRGAGHRRHGGDAGRGRGLRRRPGRHPAAQRRRDHDRGRHGRHAVPADRAQCRARRGRRLAAAADPGRGPGDRAEHPAVLAGHHRHLARAGLLSAVALRRVCRAVPVGGGGPCPRAGHAAAAGRMSTAVQAQPAPAHGHGGSARGEPAPRAARRVDQAAHGLRTRLAAPRASRR